MVLLDLGFLVLDAYGRGDIVGDDPGAERAWGAALAAGVDAASEDQADPVGSADVEVVADELLQEDPAGDGPVEHLGEGELGLDDGDVVAVAGGGVLVGERVGQLGQPLAQQRLDLVLAETVADRLERGHVIDGGEGVVQRLEPDTGLGRLPFRPFVAVDAQPRVVGKVGAELDEERPEVGVHAVEVEVVDLHRGAGQPQVAGPGHRVATLLRAEHRRLLLRATDEQDTLPVLTVRAGGLGQVPMGDVVLVLPLPEVHQVQVMSGDVVVDVGDERVSDRLHQHR